MRKKFLTLRSYTVNNKLFLFIAVLVFVTLFAIHGMLPGMGGTGTISGRFMILGYMECGAESLHSLAELKCGSTGGSAGGLMPTGSPIYIFGALLIRFLGLNPEWALAVVWTVVGLIALAGTYRLIKILGVSRYVALLAGFLYLITVGIISMQSFGGTYWGFLLMPAAIYAVVSIIASLKVANIKSVIRLAIAWSLLSTFQLFTDGYSFFITLTVAGIYILFEFWRKWFTRRALIVYSVFLFASIMAYALYTFMVPSSGSWGGANLSLVRAMGLDISTAFSPSSGIWWADLSGVKVQASRLWGDGSNSAYNYIGYSILVLASYGVYNVLRGKQTFVTKRRVLTLIIVATVAFVLSLGPSVKWNTQKPLTESEVITYESYLMPADQALVNLPTSAMIERAPGLSSMRAIYRWHLLTHLVLVLLAAVGIQCVINKKSGKYAILLVGLIFIELSPNPYKFISRGFQNGEQVSRFNSQVVEPLKEELNKGEIVLFYPNAQGGNDYLANYLAPRLDIRTFNVGNDKALAYAKPSRPEAVQMLLSMNDKNRENDELLTRSILEDETIDVIIVPYFDLRWDSYAWPPSSNGSGPVRGKEFIQRIEVDQSLDIKKYDKFAIVRLNMQFTKETWE